MKRIEAQVIIAVTDTGEFIAEIATPGKSGRRKLQLRDGMWEVELRAELNTYAVVNREARREADLIAEQNRRQSQADHDARVRRELYDNVARKHGVGLARKVVPDVRKRGQKQVAARINIADL